MDDKPKKLTVFKLGCDLHIADFSARLVKGEIPNYEGVKLQRVEYEDRTAEFERQKLSGTSNNFAPPLMRKKNQRTKVSFYPAFEEEAKKTFLKNQIPWKCTLQEPPDPRTQKVLKNAGINSTTENRTDYISQYNPERSGRYIMLSVKDDKYRIALLSKYYNMIPAKRSYQTNQFFDQKTAAAKNENDSGASSSTAAAAKDKLGISLGKRWSIDPDSEGEEGRDEKSNALRDHTKRMKLGARDEAEEKEEEEKEYEVEQEEFERERIERGWSGDEEDEGLVSNEQGFGEEAICKAVGPDEPDHLRSDKAIFKILKATFEDGAGYNVDRLLDDDKYAFDSSEGDDHDEGSESESESDNETRLPTKQEEENSPTASTVDPHVITREQVVQFLKTPATLSQLHHHFKNKLKAKPDATSKLMSILKSVAKLENNNWKLK